MQPAPIAHRIINGLWRGLFAIYKFCGSLKLAVVVVLGLAITLAAATFYEAEHGTKAVQTVIYRSTWFSFLLAGLGINIFASAMSRYPWKRRHAGFLVAHIGILTVLLGSAVTRKFGIDGTLPLASGEVGSLVSIDDNLLEIWDKKNNRWVYRDTIDPKKIQETLTQRKSSKTESGPLLRLDGNGANAIVTDALAHAETRIFFESSADINAPPAVEIEIFSEATGINQSQWFQSDDPQFRQATMGLALVRFAKAGAAKLKKSNNPHGNTKHGGDDDAVNGLELLADGNQLRYIIKSRSLGTRKGLLKSGEDILTGWRDFRLRIKNYFPHSQMRFAYNAPQGVKAKDLPAAVELALETPYGLTASRWFGFGESVELTSGAGEYLVRFGPRIVPLPFALKLEEFQIGKYPGTDRAMTYQSRVSLVDSVAGIDQESLITMNEPLKHKGYYFYQASYQETPMGYVSVFSVGKDPGRPAKYLGSLLIVLGIIIMYIDRTSSESRRRPAAKPEGVNT